MHKAISGTLIGLIVAASMAASGKLAAGEIMTPLERVASTPKGQLKNPYADFASVAEQGHKIYMSSTAVAAMEEAAAAAWPHPHQSDLDLWR